MMETRIIRMQQDQRTAEAEINSLLNRKPGSPLGEPVEDEPRPLPMTLDELLARAAATAPELERRQKMIARSELSVNLARKEFHADYTVSAGYFNQGSMSPMYQVRVDIPLRLHAEQKQRPALNEQVDLLAGARRSFEAAEQDLQFRIREAVRRSRDGVAADEALYRYDPAAKPAYGGLFATGLSDGRHGFRGSAEQPRD